MSKNHSNMNPVRYYYEGGLHCPYCAKLAGMDGDCPVPTDFDGNEVTVGFSWDGDPDDPYYCETCGAATNEVSA